MSSQTVVETEIRDIPLSRLKIAPWNARKTFDNESIAELAASMNQNGIITPLLVRPLNNGEKEYEIVGGHRRRAAAVQACLPTAPCIVRDLTDEEAREIGMLENLQREDLPPLEEAHGFADLLRSRAGSTIESIAATLGKDASYVGRRLKLLNAIQPVQDALAAGAIEVGHALELARLSEKQQGDLLEWLNVGYSVPNDHLRNSQARADSWKEDTDDDDDPEVCADCGEEGCVCSGAPICQECGQEETFCDCDQFTPREGKIKDADAESTEPQWYATPKTVALLRAQIAKSELVVLGTAPFPLEDEIPPMACTECPKRTSANSLLFNDIAQDTCTDRDCYDGKIRAWVRYSIQHAEEQGAKLVALTDRYQSEFSNAVNQYSVIVIDDPDQQCPHMESAIWINGEKAGHLQPICRTKTCDVHYQANGSARRPGAAPTPEQTAEDLKREAKEKAERKKVLDKVKVQKRYRAALLSALGTAEVNNLPLESSNNMLIEVVQFAIDRMTNIYNKKFAETMGWDESLIGWGSGPKLRRHLAGLTEEQRLRAALIAIHMNDIAVHEYSVNQKNYRPEGFEQIAAYIGIDPKPLKTAAEESVKPKQPSEKQKPDPKLKAKDEPELEAKPTSKTAKKTGAARKAELQERLAKKAKEKK